MERKHEFLGLFENCETGIYGLAERNLGLRKLDHSQTVVDDLKSLKTRLGDEFRRLLSAADELHVDATAYIFEGLPCHVQFYIADTLLFSTIIDHVSIS